MQGGGLQFIYPLIVEYPVTEQEYGGHPGYGESHCQHSRYGIYQDRYQFGVDCGSRNLDSENLKYRYSHNDYQTHRKHSERIRQQTAFQQEAGKQPI